VIFCYYFSIHIKNIFSFYKINFSLLSHGFFLLFFITQFISCSPSERFTKKEVTVTIASGLRILLNEYGKEENISVESFVYLSDQSSKLTLIQAGSTIRTLENNGSLKLSVNGKYFIGDKFLLSSAENEEILKINGNAYRGQVQISSTYKSIHLINIVNLEDYVKGVLAREMPLGKNNENFEALKALAVCIRTYAIKKMQDGKVYFDLYSDTRDQVYGGVDAETPLSNKAVDETKKLILKYDGKPATIYYHSTCGGYTESSQNVFTNDPVPYLISIKDGDEPYCKISPRFQWKEIYEKEEIISRLKNYDLLENTNYELEDISISNKFESGRVSELEIKVIDSYSNTKSLIIRGNEIRSILRTSDNKNILWSILFDLSVESNSIVLTGHGFGHGVGLCQWGAIALSRKDWNYKDILQHYYPGINTGYLND